MLKCQICGFEDEKSILSHVRTVHRICSKDYKSRYPGFSLRASWMANDPDAMENFRVVGRRNKERMKDKRSHAKLPDGKWSRKHAECVSCGRKDVPHVSNGKCKNCNGNDYVKLKTSKKNEIIERGGNENIDYVICKICGRPFETLTTNGHLKEHDLTVGQYKHKFPRSTTRCEKSLKKLGLSISMGRRKLMLERGYLNPESQRMSKSAEMSRRHSQGLFSKVSLAESKMATWLLSRGYNIKVGTVLTGNENIVQWQANVLPGCCVDFAVESKRTVIEILGKWWHGLDYLEGREDFESLHPAVKKNIALDKKRFEILKENNWTVVKIWDNEIDMLDVKVGDIFPIIGKPVGQNAEELLIMARTKEDLSSDTVDLGSVAKTYREKLNARWLASSGFVCMSKSKIKSQDAERLRIRLLEIGDKSAVPNDLIESEFLKIRKRGFPYHVLSEDEQRLEWNQLLKAHLKKNTKGAFRWAGHGTRLANMFHPHMFECRKKGKMSPREFFDSDKDLKRGIEKMLCIKGRMLTASDMREICKSESATGWVNNFPPRVAVAVLKSIFDNPSDMKILDPCAGFSGRLIGSAVAGVSEYVGIDLSPDTARGLEDTKTFLERMGCGTKVRIIQGDCLTVMPGLEQDFDAILASTPFWDAEQYKGISVDMSYEQWCNNFLVPFFSCCKRCLKKGGLVAFYADYLKNRDFPGDIARIANEHFSLKQEIMFIKNYDEMSRSKDRPRRYVQIPVWTTR